MGTATLLIKDEREDVCAAEGTESEELAKVTEEVLNVKEVSVTVLVGSLLEDAELESIEVRTDDIETVVAADEETDEVREDSGSGRSCAFENGDATSNVPSLSIQSSKF